MELLLRNSRFLPKRNSRNSCPAPGLRSIPALLDSSLITVDQLFLSIKQLFNYYKPTLVNGHKGKSTSFLSNSGGHSDVNDDVHQRKTNE